MPKPAPTEEFPDTEVSPDPSLERRTRRTFSMADKLAIIAKADACQHGELGALLRQHGLYSQQVNAWRRQLADGGQSALAKSAPGPAPRLSAEQKENEKLRRENAQLTRKLEIAEGCIELQKKLSHLLEQANNESGS